MPTKTRKKCFSFCYGPDEIWMKDEIHDFLKNISIKLGTKNNATLYYALKYYLDYIKDRVVEYTPREYSPEKKDVPYLLIRRGNE